MKSTYLKLCLLATSAMLGGEAQLLIDGGEALVRTLMGGNNDLVFIAGIAVTYARAKKDKPQELYDRRYLDDMEKSGFMDKI